MKINVGKEDICYNCKYGKQVTCEATHLDIEFNRIEKRIVKCKCFEEKEKKPKRSAFVKPTVEEVETYCTEKGYSNVDANKFINYYDTVGWKVGKTLKPMVSWKKAVANWNAQQKEWDSEKAKKASKDKLQGAATYNLSDYSKFAMGNTEI